MRNLSEADAIGAVEDENEIPNRAAVGKTTWISAAIATITTVDAPIAMIRPLIGVARDLERS